MVGGKNKKVLNNGHGVKFPLALSAHPEIKYDVTGSKFPIGSSHDNMIDIFSADNTVRVTETFITGSGTVASVVKQSLI